MSLVRIRIQLLSTSTLWSMCDEMNDFEKTGVIQNDSLIRKIASELMTDTSMAMMLVGAEVWRELAYRSKPEEVKL